MRFLFPLPSISPISLPYTEALPIKELSEFFPNLICLLLWQNPDLEASLPLGYRKDHVGLHKTGTHEGIAVKAHITGLYENVVLIEPT